MRLRPVLYAVLLLAPVSASARSKIAVLSVETVQKDNVKAYTEVVTSELSAINAYDVISAQDIATMLGYEATKQTLDCDESTCLAEIGGALGADKILSSTVDVFESSTIVTIKLIDMRTSSIDGRVSRTESGTSSEIAIKALRNGVRELFGLRAAGALVPPGAVSITAGAVGVAGIATGIVFGLKANSAYKKATDPDYVGGMQAASDGRTDQTIANIGFAVGAVGVVGGALWWWLVDNDPRNASVVTSVNVAALNGGGAVIVGGRF